MVRQAREAQGEQAAVAVALQEGHLEGLGALVVVVVVVLVMLIHPLVVTVAIAEEEEEEGVLSLDQLVDLLEEEEEEEFPAYQARLVTDLAAAAEWGAQGEMGPLRRCRLQYVSAADLAAAAAELGGLADLAAAADQMEQAAWEALPALLMGAALAWEPAGGSFLQEVLPVQ